MGLLIGRLLRVNREQMNFAGSDNVNVLCLVVVDDVGSLVGREIGMQRIDGYVSRPSREGVTGGSRRILCWIPNGHRRYFIFGDGPPYGL